MRQVQMSQNGAPVSVARPSGRMIEQVVACFRVFPAPDNSYPIRGIAHIFISSMPSCSYHSKYTNLMEIQAHHRFGSCRSYSYGSSSCQENPHRRHSLALGVMHKFRQFRHRFRYTLSESSRRTRRVTDSKNLFGYFSNNVLMAGSSNAMLWAFSILGSQATFRWSSAASLLPHRRI